MAKSSFRSSSLRAIHGATMPTPIPILDIALIASMSPRARMLVDLSPDSSSSHSMRRCVSEFLE